MRTKRALVGLTTAAILVLATACSAPMLASSPPSERPAASASPAPRLDRSPEVQPFDRSAHSTTDPASIWVVVNKSHPVAPVYRPEISLVRGYQLATPAAGALIDLLAASDDVGLGFKIASAYRSYDYQAGVYAQVVAASGQTAADLVSARPGHSEHQTGLAVDLVTPADPGCDFEACFAGTPGGRWLAKNAWHYGFVIRYQPASAAVTGYSPEPWHLRFVGRELTAELRRTHVDTLEEFFHISGGDYP